MGTIAKKICRPPRYVVAALLCSVGGFLQGIDTGIIGPVTVMGKYVEHFGHPSPAIHGLIVSSILLSAAVTSFLAGHVADSLGRPLGVAIGALVFALGAVLEAGAVRLGMFIAGRLIVGVGEGFINGIMLAYICEISPARHRGALTTGPQLFVCFGILAGFFTCYGTARIETDLSWRLPFILLAIYAATFSAAACLLLPPSPRWLADQGKGKTEIAAAWTTLEVKAADNDAPETASPADLPTTIPRKGFHVMDVLAPEARPRFFMAIFLMAMQQLSGIDGVLYYAPLLFQQAGIGADGDTFLVSGILAIVIFAVTIPATVWADSWGRRTNTIFGGLGMAGCMFLLGGLYAGNAVSPTSTARWVAVVTIYVFTAIFCISWGIVLKIYAAEIQPQRTRATATSIALGANWLTNFVVALITPILLSKTSCGAYFLFAGCTSATAVVCWFAMPETRRRTLAEIQQDFRSSRAKKHILRRS
ncbi:sugar transporter [Cordyceps javanica]|uniref:Sugar transporter n=1 Tax=Cordyceps javanica TaxID=43265 RepID=A0A545VF24_9HYPO|nr:sugar transporter [Cordyceps javanica]TQW11513.1 sugar transporter [Cordyceps javanica]